MSPQRPTQQYQLEPQAFEITTQLPPESDFSAPSISEQQEPQPETQNIGIAETTPEAVPEAAPPDETSSHLGLLARLLRRGGDGGGDY